MRGMNCRYNVAHALTAVAVLLVFISKNFWHNFLHGSFHSPPPASTIVFLVVGEATLFGLLLLGLWGSTFVSALRDKNRQPPDSSPLTEPPPPMGRLGAATFALKAAVPICLTALAIAMASTFVFDKLLHIDAAGQDLVEWLKPGTYPAFIRMLLIAFAVLEAPLLEEPLFRGVMFRGFAKAMPAWGAMPLSGFCFALIHVNAVTMFPLWFLGVAFAWLYWRTGSLLAPIIAHCLFNLLNVALVFMGVST